jgi:hypothetical protein
MGEGVVLAPAVSSNAYALPSCGSSLPFAPDESRSCDVAIDFSVISRWNQPVAV